MKVTLTLPAMRCVLLSLFLLGSLASFAQPRWAFGLQGAGLYSIVRRAGTADVKDFYSQEHMPTASGGLVVQYRAGNRVQLESGLQLTGIGFRHVFSYTSPAGVRISQRADQSFTCFKVPVTTTASRSLAIASRSTVMGSVLPSSTVIFFEIAM